MNPAPPFCSIVDRSKIVYNSSETPDRAPVNLLETFIPGYGAVHKFILHAFGFDVTYIVFFGAIVLLVIRVLWRYFTSTISFDNDDPLYHAFMRFSAQLSVQSQHLIARTPKRSAWNVKAGEMNTKKILLNGTPTSVHDFSGLGLASPLYMPAGGNYFLQFKDIRFQLRVKETAIRRMPSAEAPSSNKVIITLLCMGRSTKPLEELLDHVREQYRKGDQNEIRIKKPVPESTRRFGRGSDWEAATVQPARLLGTIAFDPEKKRKIISDIHHFLDVKTVKWYNDHCIPYRRGYLFHGPPGTGKTSMVMAIASTFGLDVHIATLSNTKLTDEDFEALMGKLPPRCVVLLDDVDPDRFIEYPDKPNERISLPCLLNAIDGLLAPQGRILIMTTNKRDSFDTVVEAALFRPGRIDLEVAFSRAPNLQIQQLFLALYQISQQPYKSPLAERTNKTSDAIHNAEPMDAQKLSQLAKQFSDKIPENMLSPAEIQGFLMRWKDNPRGACENVEKWTQEMKTAKKAGDWVSQDEPVTKPRRRGVLSMLGRKPRSALLQK